MRDLSIEEIKTAADPVAACKEQIRRWKISYSRYCGSRRGGLYYELKEDYAHALDCYTKGNDHSKGQLVRTSKTHAYNWAILEEKDDGTLKVYGCRAERAAADTELTQVIRRGHPYARVVPLDTEPNPPALTFDQFMALARENYGKGGDGYVECWDDRTFAYFVKEFGPITRASALDAFAQALDQENEERAIRNAAAKGEW